MGLAHDTRFRILGRRRLAAAAGVAAVVVVLLAVVYTLGPGASASQTAFASAPAGAYAITARTEGGVDVVLAVPLSAPAESVEVARVPHLEGYASSGAVSPTGRWLALVVADAGTRSRPSGSLTVVGLESGEQRTLATGVDPLQTPVWTSDGAAVVVTRSRGEGPLLDVAIVQVPVTSSGALATIAVPGVLGAYPVAFAADGALLSVAIGRDGSVLLRDGQPFAQLSAQITRDWRLSPDGRQLAFIETSTDGGVEYRARVVSLVPGGASVSAQSAGGDRPSLGAAWKPGSASPTFGTGPGAGAGGVSAQGLPAGFDIPLAYSPDGAVLAAQSWSGASFQDPGAMRLALVSAAGRVSLDATRFYGWASR